MDEVAQHKSCPIKPPTAALNYHTHKERCDMKEGSDVVDVEMTLVVQIIKSHVESLKMHEGKHREKSGLNFMRNVMQLWKGWDKRPCLTLLLKRYQVQQDLWLSPALCDKVQALFVHDKML